jgi:hypothetical protein
MPEMIVGSDNGELLSETKKAETDTQLRMMWSDLHNALANKDIEKALTYFSILSREQYEGFFKELGDHLPEIAQEMQDIETVYIERHSAKYFNRRNELYGGMKVDITFEVYFVVDPDGSWKIGWY